MGPAAGAGPARSCAFFVCRRGRGPRAAVGAGGVGGAAGGAEPNEPNREAHGYPGRTARSGVRRERSAAKPRGGSRSNWILKVI